MFTRFVQSARTAVVEAQAATRALGHDSVTPSHMLVGVARAEPELTSPLTAEQLQSAIRAPGIDRRALASIGIDYDAVEREVEASFGPGALASGRTCGQLAFAPESKKALELALREAQDREDEHIGPEHLLLALLDDHDVAEVIRRCGADPKEMKDRL
ncbi:MAG TPA: Clp protease N-terminal domain-containing protein [Thermoleophilaceae bacterium]